MLELTGWSAAWPTLVLLLVLSATILILAALPEATLALRYERELMMSPTGAVRWLGAHLVHLGWSHTLLNLAGLWLVAAYLGPGFGARAWAAALLVTAIAVDLGLYLGDPALGWYVGLSGVLHGALMAGLVAAAGIPRSERWTLGILVAAKILWEQLAGPVPGSELVSGGSVVVDAHLYGAMGGLLVGACIRAMAPRPG